MRTWLANCYSNPWLFHKLVIATLLIATAAGGYYLGRRQATAASKTSGPDGLALDPVARDAGHSGRVVAYIYGQPVSREEFGEYLISRLGKDRLELMVNRKIVETECRKAGVFATDDEIELRLQQDLIAFGGPTKLTVKDFETGFLNRFGKTLYEWKEDVIRPKIMMEKLVRPMVKLDDKALRAGFEARFGPQVECRMIVLLEKDMTIAQKVWEQARKGRDAFLEQARKQAIPQLAAAEGKVPPIHRHLGDKELEDAAFRMKPGEISGLIKMKDGSCVILLCEKQLAANNLAKFEEERVRIHQDLTQAHVQQMIPQVLNDFRRAAAPRYVLDNRGEPSASILPASYSPSSPSEFKPRPVVVPPEFKGQSLPPADPPTAPPNVKKPVDTK